MMGLDPIGAGHARPDTPPIRDAWGGLRDELDRWAAAGRRATVWWRDDDTIAATPALARLLGLARGHGVRPALAVVPAGARPDLFAALDTPAAAVIQHGYAHRNHAPSGARKTELGPHRPAATVLAELADGRAMLAAATRGRALPVLAPPWNRIDPAVAARLAEAGFRGLSTVKPRAAHRDGHGLVHVNVHVDPIDWAGLRAGRAGFAGAEAALGAVLAHLRARRLGTVDADEATGLLTHHLVMDEAGWAFVDRFLTVTLRHPAAAWPDPAGLFATGT
jgi:hypothetical protein